MTAPGIQGIGSKSRRSLAKERYARQGMTIEEVAHSMGEEPETIRDWIHPSRKPLKRTASKPRRQSISPASKAQRQKVEGKACARCRKPGPCDPAHLIARGMASDGDGDPRAVVPLCRGPEGCHRLYDAEHISLLEHLEPHYRTELAFAVERFGLLSTLHRVSGQRWQPMEAA